ncbi:hypothetical protein D3C76_1248310 [compost metagenome]
MQVHRQGVRVAGGVGQGFLAGEHETHARHAFQAFAGSGDQRIERHLLGVHRQRAEGAHRIDDQAFAVLLDHLGDFRQRIEDAGAGFAVNQGHMSDSAIGA